MAIGSANPESVPRKGGGGTQIFHEYVDLDHFWGFKILNFNIFFFWRGGGGGGGVRKKKYFWV